MNLHFTITQEVFDGQINKHINRRIKELINNDEYIKQRIDEVLNEVLEKKVNKILDQLGIRADLDKRVDRLIINNAMPSKRAIANSCLDEIQKQVKELLEVNPNIVEDVKNDNVQMLEILQTI